LSYFGVGSYYSFLQCHWRGKAYILAPQYPQRMGFRTSVDTKIWGCPKSFI
jgi:hypothetical protein